MILLAAMGLVLLRVFYSLGEMFCERDWPRNTWRGLILSAALLFLCASAFGQEVYVSQAIQTSGPNIPTTGGALPQVLWVANAAVFVCAHPSASLSACQAALTTTFTDSTGSTPCPTSAQLVQMPGNTCTSSSGVTSNVGFWYPGGQIDYWVTSAYGTFGPFTITGGDANPFLCTFTGSQSFTCTGTVKAGFVQGDIEPNASKYFDPRVHGALCNFTGNDTPAFNAMFTQGSWIQNPVGFCDLTVPSGTATAGVFNNSSTYNLNDTVTSNGNIFISLSGSNTGITPGSVATSWSNSTPYVIGNLVGRANQNYICLANNTGNDPLTSPGFWELTGWQSLAAVLLPQPVDQVEWTGRGKWFQSVMKDNAGTAIHAPIVQLGTPAGLSQGDDLSNMMIDGATSVAYPYGMLNISNVNLSHLYDLTVNCAAGTTTGANYGIYEPPLLGSFEMIFGNISAFGCGQGTGISLSASSDFEQSNIENWTTGLSIIGGGGECTFGWRGGHFERIAYNALYVDECQPVVSAVTLSTGNIYLGDGAANGNIQVSGWGSASQGQFFDNGINTKFQGPSTGSLTSNPINTNGDEWYRVAGNVNTDATFSNSGTSGWSGTNATCALAGITSPGASVGTGLLVTPTSPGGYCAKTFTVNSATDYTIASVLLFNSVNNQARIEVFDQASNLLWDSQTITPTSGILAVGSAQANFAYRFIKFAIPQQGTVTSYTVQIMAPVGISSPIDLLALFIVPSTISMTTATPVGTGSSCTGVTSGTFGLSATCTVTGEGGIGASRYITFTVPASTNPELVRFHVVTDPTAVIPTMTINNRQSSLLQPGTALDYVIATGLNPTTVTFFDLTGPTGTSADMVISQFAVLPYTTVVVPTIPLSGLAVQANNTVVANATSGSAAPTAIPMPSCSGSGSALLWTTSGGAGALSCNNSIAAATATSAGIATSATALSGGALGSGVYQSAAGATAYIASPTTNAHTFMFGWQPLGSAVVPTAIDVTTNVTAAAALTSTAFMTGAGGQASQTPAATSTLDASGDAIFAGSVTADGGQIALSHTSHLAKAPGFESAGGTKFTATGCTSITSTLGGSTAGSFVIGAATCTVVITMNGATGLTAATGWSCHANDKTTAAGNTGMYFSANNTTTATLTVPSTASASDVIDFACTAF